jgi:signal transduction histidine kinase/pSer/pThr/pTyr-binding forkhead associated (FHA) protein
MAKLIIKFSKKPETEVALSDDEVLIGRLDDNQIIIDDQSVSRRHARIYRKKNVYVIEDLGSLNGTEVNGLDIIRHNLAFGDVVDFGSVQLYFVQDDGVISKSKKLQKKARAEVTKKSTYVTTSEFVLQPEDVDAVEGDLGEYDKKLLRKAYERLGILYKTTNELSGVTKLPELFNKILKFVNVVFESDCTFALLVEDKSLDSEDLRPDYICPKKGGRGSGKKFVSRAIIKKVMETGQSILSSDALKDERSIDSDSIIMQDIRSTMCAPIKVRGQIVGVVQTDTRGRLQGFSEGDLELLTAICNSVSIAIENVRLFESLRQSNKELYDQQQQLIEAAKLSAFGVLAGGLVHEINAPLQVISLASENVKGALAKEKLSAQLSKNCNKNLDLIVDKVKQCNAIVKNLIKFVRREDVELGPVDINSSVEGALLISQLHFSNYRVELEIILEKKMPHVLADSTQLQQVFLNILINAMDAMAEAGGVLTIRSFKTDDGRVAVQFKDTGPGIPKDKVKDIFRPLYTTKSGAKGTGLGLTISKKIIDSLSGKIDVESVLNEGTTFTIKVPICNGSEETTFG